MARVIKTDGTEQKIKVGQHLCGTGITEISFDFKDFHDLTDRQWRTLKEWLQETIFPRFIIPNRYPFRGLKK